MRVACRLPNSGTTWLRVADRTGVRLMPCENVCTCGLQDAHICRPFSHGILFVDSSIPSPAAVPHFVGPCCAPSVSARHFTVSQLLLAITRCRVEGCPWPWTMLHTTADNVAHGRGQRCTRPRTTLHTAVCNEHCALSSSTFVSTFFLNALPLYGSRLVCFWRN